MNKYKLKRLWILLIILPILMTLTHNVSAYETNGTNNKLEILLDDNYPPYSFKDSSGNLQGISVDQWLLWQKKTGIEVHLNSSNWESALRKIRTGKFDVIDTIYFNEERANYLDFTKPYARIEMAAYFQKNISGIANIESLKGFNIGVKAGDNAISILKDNGVDSIIEYQDYDAIIEAVKEQKIVTFVMDKPSANYFLYKNDLQNKFNNTASLYYGELHRAVLKGNTALLNSVESGFSLISEKEYSDIDKKWSGIQQNNSLPILGIMIAVMIVATVVLMLLLWSMTLKKAVKAKTKILSETLEKYKESERNIYNMSTRDSLTGLYNRNFFENELNKYQSAENLNMGVVVCDIDGLKLINDTLGHSVGDDYLKEVANILRHSFDEEDVIARIGGDEFAILAKNTTSDKISSQKQKVSEMLIELNLKERVMPISMSVGFVVGNSMQKDLRELLKTADNWMYREKLHHLQSEKSNNIRILMKMLEVRDFITEGHGDRMQELSARLADSVSLSESEIKDMSLFAQFHDIGKIGIPDRILFKPGKLTDEEMNEMKRHTEIGYRIAEASSDLKHISDWILKHHEWWNGQGYPFNLKGEEIPIQCRILSIVDAFDAMTNNRPYRKAISKEAACQEIVRFKGSQFDPSLVEIFIKLVQAKRNEVVSK